MYYLLYICVKTSKKKFCLAGVTYTIITRCLHKGEDIVVQHFAAKTVENVATTSGRHCVKFATNDTAQVWIAFVVQVRLLLKHPIKIFTKFTLLVENALCLKQVFAMQMAFDLFLFCIRRQ